MRRLMTALIAALLVAGILPFTAPKLWRETFRKLVEMSDGQIRMGGLLSMIAGLLILFLT